MIKQLICLDKQLIQYRVVSFVFNCGQKFSKYLTVHCIKNLMKFDLFNPSLSTYFLIRFETVLKLVSTNFVCRHIYIDNCLQKKPNKIQFSFLSSKFNMS